MSSISALLNPETAPGQARAPSQESFSLSAHTHTTTTTTTTTTTYEAADALTTLATLGSGQAYAPPRRELPSPTAFSHAPRRTSSFGSHVAPVEPVEPSPPIEHPQAHSPTLDQYHHGSKSPEEQRRQSLLTRTSPAPILAPIQSLSNVLHERIHEEPQHMSASYGTDVSQMVPPPSRSSEDAEPGRDGTQNREPAFVRDEPTTSQIRAPETSVHCIPHPIVTNMPLSQHDPQSQLPSPAPIIKNEPTGTPREATPAAPIAQLERQRSITADNVDAETLKAIEAVKQNELGLRAKKASMSENAPSPTDTLKPSLAPSKKRPAPPTSAATKKKGTAAPKKPPPKKRKIETDADRPRSDTPSSARNSKPPGSRGGKKGSQANTPAAESSPAPDHSSQIHASDEEADSSDDGTLYCICRKPDNHQWMIGCDGGCDDWFHGACVNMQRTDEPLLDKFFCPSCETAGKGRTTWKPMCRREGCRQPARLTKGTESKYCSDECGFLFFQQQLQRTAGAKKLSPPAKKPKKKGSKDAEEPEQQSDEEDEPTPLGGVLRAKDLKALAVASKDIDAFKRLGSGVLSPPQTASPTKSTFDSSLPNGTFVPTETLVLTAAESANLGALHTEKTHLQARLEVLKDREKFVSMVREQANRHAEKENMKSKAKEFCGYDSRLAWSDTEFLCWRSSNAGLAAFKFNTLSLTSEQVAAVGDSKEEHMTGVVNGGDKEKEKEGVCMKKRCPKHPNWQKLNLQDARFEEMEVVESIKECEKEERKVKERAQRRSARDVIAGELGAGTGNEEKNREGWVEVVGA